MHRAQEFVTSSALLLRLCCELNVLRFSHAALAEEVRAGQKRLAEAQTALAAAKAAALAADAQTLPNGARHLIARVDGIDAKGLQVRSHLKISFLEGHFILYSVMIKLTSSGRGPVLQCAVCAC